MAYGWWPANAKRVSICSFTKSNRMPYDLYRMAYDLPDLAKFQKKRITYAHVQGKEVAPLWSTSLLLHLAICGRDAVLQIVQCACADACVAACVPVWSGWLLWGQSVFQQVFLFSGNMQLHWTCEAQNMVVEYTCYVLAKTSHKETYKRTGSTCPRRPRRPRHLWLWRPTSTVSGRLW
jgi:hypothetical protein